MLLVSAVYGRNELDNNITYFARLKSHYVHYLIWELNIRCGIYTLNRKMFTSRQERRVGITKAVVFTDPSCSARPIYTLGDAGSRSWLSHLNASTFWKMLVPLALHSPFLKCLSRQQDRQERRFCAAANLPPPPPPTYKFPRFRRGRFLEYIIILTPIYNKHFPANSLGIGHRNKLPSVEVEQARF